MVSAAVVIARRSAWLLVLLSILLAGCAAHEKGAKKRPGKPELVVKKAEEMPVILPEAVAKAGNATERGEPELPSERGRVANATVSVPASLNATHEESLEDLAHRSREMALEREINAQMAHPERLQGSFGLFMLNMERPEVDGFVEGYLGNRADSSRLMRHLKRASGLVGVAKRVMREEGMPTALAYLPIIESGYQSSIRSRSHAVGYWQFVETTARRYGLRMDRWVDERRDIERSTRAAARYLRELYGMFGSWELALAAYNGGEGRVLRALGRGGAMDFWSLVESGELRRESSEYVPRFLAVLKILTNAGRYRVPQVESGAPVFYKAGLPGGVSLSTVARWSGVKVGELKELNPEVLRNRVPPFLSGYVIRFPTTRSVARVERVLAHSIRAKRRSYARRRPIRHRVKKGETLGALARRYGVSVSAIMSRNRIRDPRKIRPGRLLYIPAKRGSDRSS